MIATRRMPANDAVVVLAVLVAGIAAAHLVVPSFWLTTPLLGGMLIVASRRAARSPAPVGPSAAPLPPRVERAVADAFAAVPAGATRDLLADVVRRARSLLHALGDATDDRRLVRDVTDLVDACCEIAQEHSRLDAVLPALWEPALAPAAARGSADDVRGDELRRRGAAGRELLLRRLRDASTALDEMLLQQGANRSGPAADRVAELTSELTAEAAARRHAAEDIQRLLTR